MYPKFTKSFKFRRLCVHYKKFRHQSNRLGYFLKTSAKEKLSKTFKKLSSGCQNLRVKLANHRVQVEKSQADTTLLEPPKIKPKPLKGVKIHYELLPIRKR